MSVTALSNAVSCDVFAGAFPFARPRTAIPLEVLAPTGPAGFAKSVANYIAITIIDSYLSAGEYYKSFPSTHVRDADVPVQVDHQGGDSGAAEGAFGVGAGVHAAFVCVRGARRLTTGAQRHRERTENFSLS